MSNDAHNTGMQRRLTTSYVEVAVSVACKQIENSFVVLGGAEAAFTKRLVIVLAIVVTVIAEQARMQALEPCVQNSPLTGIARRMKIVLGIHAVPPIPWFDQLNAGH